MKTKITLLGVIALLVASLGVAVRVASHRLRDAQAYANNMEALLEQSRHDYVVRDSLHAASVRALELTRREYKQYVARTAPLIRDLQARDNQVRAAVTSLARDSVSFRTQVQHVGDPLTGDSLTVEYSDRYTRFTASIRGDTLAATFLTDVPITQVFWNEPRFRLLGINFGHKGLRQEIVSENPSVRIIYSEYVSIRRRGARAK